LTRLFDKANYQALLKRLAVKEISYVTVRSDEVFRFEAEFYIAQTQMLGERVKGADVFDLIQYGTSEELNDEQLGFPVLRLNEFNSYFSGIPSRCCNRLTVEDFECLRLQAGDVLVCRTNGNPNLVGRAAVVVENTQYAYASYLFKIRTRKEIILPEVLVLFMRGKYGREQIHKYSMKSNQTNFSPAKFREIEIPRLDLKLQNVLRCMMRKAYQQLQQSQSLYSVAGDILFSELGLLNWQPPTHTATQKNLSEFHASGRLDAEYYQPKYDELRAIVEKNAKTICLVSAIQEFNARGLQPIYDPDGPLDVINSKHILDDGLDYDNFEKTSINKWDEQQKAQVFRNDILIYTTGANIGRTAIYLRDKPALASNHVNILRVKAKEKIYVAFVLNSMIGRLQTEKLSAGSAQQELYPKDVAQFYVPFISEEKQAEISKKILESFALRAQSQKLLELAKRAVEVAIESGEDAALGLLK